MGSRFFSFLCMLALAVTGLFALEVSEPEHARAAVDDLLACEPTSPFVYNLRSPDSTVGGERLNQVERINTDEEGSEPEVIVDFSDLVPEQTNALGIGRDAQARGRYLYFTTSNIGSRHGSSVPPDDQDVRNVYRYDLLTEELTSQRIPNDIWRADSNHIVRHGAVDHSSGIYYFATSQTGSDAFSLIAYHPDSGEVWLAGNIHTPGAVGDSGDMAFDSLGNLYFIVGAGSAAHLYTAAAGALPTSPPEDPGSNDIILSRTGYSAGMSGSNGVGVAYGHHGYLYVTFGNGQLHQVDPSTGRSLGAVNQLAPAQPGSSAPGGASTDLASCSAPSTLTVRKNVHSRADDGDQFQLDVYRDGDVDDPVDGDDVHVGQTAITTGAEDGLQAEQVGPVPILTRQPDEQGSWDYTIRETASGTTELADYETYYRCVDMNDSSFPQIDGVIEPQEGETYREFDLEIPSRTTPGSRAIVCTFTNSPPGTPRIVKEADPGTSQEVLDGVVFTGTYRCEFTGEDGEPVVNEGIWEAEGPGPARLSPDEGSELEVPVGSACEVWEDDLEPEDLPDESWSWQDPEFRSSDDPEGEYGEESATVVVTDDTAGEDANTVWVRNGAPRAADGLRVEKAVTGDPEWDDDIEFTGTWRCVYRGIDGISGTDDDVVNEGTWTVTGTGEAELVPDETSSTDIPVTSECTVEEDWPGDDGLPNATYRWNDPSYASSDGDEDTVTITAGGENQVTVTNSASGLSIEKVIAEGSPDGLADLTYTGRYECTWDEDGSSAGQWEADGPGEAELSPDSGAEAIPEGAECTVTEDALDPEDLSADYTWAEPVVEPSPLVIGPGENSATVTNAAGDEDGTFSIRKVLTDEDGVLPEGQEFSFTWQCITGDGETYPEEAPGEVTVAAGDEWESEELPEGAACTVTETDPPDPGTEGYEWSASWAIDGGEPVEGTEASFVIPSEDAAPAIEVEFTNTLTGEFGDLSVLKTVMPQDAPLPEDQEFSFTWRCVTPDGTELPAEGEEEGFTVSDGGTWSSDEVEGLQLPDGTECTINEAEPESVEGYEWQTDYVVGGSSPESGREAVVVISAEAQAQSTVEFVNTLTDDFGTFEVSKEVVDEDGVLPSDYEFDFTWRCEVAGGGLIPEEEPGSFSLSDGQSWGPESELPAGAECFVEESSPQEEDFTWETEVEANPGSEEGRTAFFTILGDGADAVEVTYINTASEDTEPSPTPTEPTESPTEPTESPTEPTETPTEPTETPTEPTESPTEPTETPTEPTESPTEPTESPTEPTETPTEPTESPTEPTESPTEPTESPTEPTESPTEPTESPTEPTDSPTPTEPTESPTEPTESPTEPTDSPTPTEPTETPTEPTESPTEPTESPTEPTESPTEPTDSPTPTEPTESPTEVTDPPTDPTEPAESPTDSPSPAEPTLTDPDGSPTDTGTSTEEASPPVADGSPPAGETHPLPAEPMGPDAAPGEGPGGLPPTGVRALQILLVALTLLGLGGALYTGAALLRARSHGG